MEQVFLPVYTLTNGLSNNLVTKTVRAALGDEHLFMDYLPHAIREKYGLCEYNYAIRQIHFPEDMETLITARRRLVFDEFFLFILSMQYQKEKHVKEKNEFVFAEDDFTDELIEQLPYELTNAQKKALADVKRDMRSETVMQRLIQGEVKRSLRFLRWQIPPTMATSLQSWHRQRCLQDSIMSPIRACVNSLDSIFRSCF